MAENSNSYGKWTVTQLKKELTKRGAVTKGKKHDLVDRYIIEIIVNS